MNALARSEYLRRLGLTDWQPRALRLSPTPDAEPIAPFALEIDRQGESASAGSPGFVEASAPMIADRPADLSTMDWAELEHWLQGQDTRGASRPVFGVGARDADLLIIGEAPGRQEDERGEPFVGRAGQLLDRMLAAIGRSRSENSYITNICKYRPPNNRDPNAGEIAADRPVLEREIALVAPRAILAVGRVAAQTLLNSDAKLGELRASVHQYPGTDIPLFITYHPAYLLRSPQEKSKVWQDLKALARALRETAA